jgi:short-subunit dehydrogenase
MDRSILQGKTALVTGASSGLGADFARQLAALGCHLVLVARREDRLNALKDEITRQHPVDILVVPLDLAVRTAPQQLFDQLATAGKVVDVLINNAGFGLHGQFLEIPWSREEEMLMLDIVTVVHLTKLFAKPMTERNFGFLLLIASIGAYQATPTYASYAAAKAFVLHFGEAINYELRRTNVRCTVLSPGITATEFLQVAGQSASLYQRMVMMDSPTVARIGIDNMLAGRPSLVPGWLNALMIWLNRLLPRRWSTAIAERLLVVG